jgi:ADP-heptose:LPS heptosyltransferase
VGAQGKALLVHPGSRSAPRIWPAERFAAVCDRAQDELGAQVVLVGGPSDQRLLAEIRSKVRSHVLALGESPSLPKFAALARSCTALLCHDSGPMHVAAAVGTPVIALYGSQNPALFQPAGSANLLMIPSMPCADCQMPGTCVVGDSYKTYCVRRNTVDQVFGAVRDVLARSS